MPTVSSPWRIEMMTLLPYRRFEVDIPLEPGAVLDGFALRVRPRQSSTVASPPGPEEYEGELTADGFRLNRIIRGRNSFMPYARGRITPTAGGSRVAVTLAMHPAAIAFLATWCVVFGAISLSIVTEWQSGTGRPPLYPLAGIPLAYGIATVAFSFEADRVERFIRDVLASTGSAD